MILVSQSPRRKEILEMAGYTFSIFHPNIDENGFESIQIEKLPVHLARLKALAAKNIYPDEVLLAADTIVVLHQKVIGKPANEKEAFEMLRKLSGKTHSVITGVCIMKDDKIIEFNDLTEVTFKRLTDEEILFYIKKHPPYDKAGSYGCQDFIGLIGIEHINGSFYNVMGLPIHKVYSTLTNFGIFPI